LGACLAATLAAGLVAAAGAQAAPQRWTRVMTPAGFSVDQPVGWRRSAMPGGGVAVDNLACPGRGAPLCDGGAEITVRSEPAIAKPKAIRAKACWSMQETLSETVEGSGRRAENNQLSCAIADRRFVLVERHLKGDKHAPNYGRILIRMAKSLRYPG
jgi:hypothetical protein